MSRSGAGRAAAVDQNPKLRGHAIALAQLAQRIPCRILDRNAVGPAVTLAEVLDLARIEHSVEPSEGGVALR